MEEREKRLANRGLYEELSRYYSLGRNQKGWSRRQLLAVGKHECHKRISDIRLTHVFFSDGGPRRV